MARLQALRQGEPYGYMLRNHFPRLRASEVFITATMGNRDTINRVECRDAIHRVHVNKPADTISLPAAPFSVAAVPSVSPVVVPMRVAPRNSSGYQFGIKTNLLYDAALVPNLGVEFPIGRHLSVGANWMYAWWNNHAKNRHWRIYGGDINARYYFDQAMTGHHVGVYGQVLVFQVAFGGKGYITGIPGENLWGKPWIGGGIEYGYSKRISRRLNLDFTLGLGYIGGEYREYRPIDGHYVWQSSHRRNWFGPTKAEISLVWLIGKEVRL